MYSKYNITEQSEGETCIMKMMFLPVKNTPSVQPPSATVCALTTQVLAEIVDNSQNYIGFIDSVDCLQISEITES